MGGDLLQPIPAQELLWLRAMVLVLQRVFSFTSPSSPDEDGDEEGVEDEEEEALGDDVISRGLPELLLLLLAFFFFLVDIIVIIIGDSIPLLPTVSFSSLSSVIKLV